MCASGKISTLSVQGLERRTVFCCIMCVSGEIRTCSVQILESKAVFNHIICVHQVKSVLILSEDWKEEQFLTTSCVQQQQWQSQVWWLNTSKYQLSSDSNRRSSQWSQHQLERQVKKFGTGKQVPAGKVDCSTNACIGGLLTRIN